MKYSFSLVPSVPQHYDSGLSLSALQLLLSGSLPQLSFLQTLLKSFSLAPSGLNVVVVASPWAYNNSLLLPLILSIPPETNPLLNSLQLNLRFV